MSMKTISLLYVKGHPRSRVALLKWPPLVTAGTLSLSYPLIFLELERSALCKRQRNQESPLRIQMKCKQQTLHIQRRRTHSLTATNLVHRPTEVRQESRRAQTIALSRLPPHLNPWIHSARLPSKALRILVPRMFSVPHRL